MGPVRWSVASARDDALRHRPPLLAVGAEQRDRRRVPCREGELPAQVHGVEQPAVHALGGRGGVDVGRVTGEKHRTPPEGVRQPVLERDHRGPRAGGDRRAQCGSLQEPVELDPRVAQVVVRVALAGRVARSRQGAPSPSGNNQTSPDAPTVTCRRPSSGRPSRSTSASTTSSWCEPPTKSTPAARRTVLSEPSHPARNRHSASSVPSSLPRTTRTPLHSKLAFLMSSPASVSTDSAVARSLFWAPATAPFAAPGPLVPHQLRGKDDRGVCSMANSLP